MLFEWVAAAVLVAIVFVLCMTSIYRLLKMLLMMMMLKAH